jgi:hypothetical protein
MWMRPRKNEQKQQPAARARFHPVGTPASGFCSAAVSTVHTDNSTNSKRSKRRTVSYFRAGEVSFTGGFLCCLFVRE